MFGEEVVLRTTSSLYTKSSLNLGLNLKKLFVWGQLVKGPNYWDFTILRDWIVPILFRR